MAKGVAIVEKREIYHGTFFGLAKINCSLLLLTKLDHFINIIILCITSYTAFKLAEASLGWRGV